MNPIDYWYKKYIALKECEKTLKPELTWEDISKIDDIISDVDDEFAFEEISRQNFYEEVLKRFNDDKERIHKTK